LLREPHGSGKINSAVDNASYCTCPPSKSKYAPTKPMASKQTFTSKKSPRNSTSKIKGSRRYAPRVLGLNENDIERSDVDILIEVVKTRTSPSNRSAHTASTVPSSVLWGGKSRRGSRRNSFSGEIVSTGGFEGRSSSLAFSFAVDNPSAPPPDVRSQKTPTPSPSNDDGIMSRDSTQGPRLTIAPSTNCSEGLDPAGKRFCGLL
jgi:hypothetical protein